MPRNSSIMNFKISPIISTLIFFLLFNSSGSSIQPTNNENFTRFEPQDELENLKNIRDYVKKVNKPALMTIKDTPKMPKWVTSHNDISEESLQPWTKSGSSCPKDIVPIRRRTEKEVLKASSIQTFEQRPRPARMTASRSPTIDHAAISAVPSEYFGAAAVVEVWAPHVETNAEYSSSQIWLWADTYVTNHENVIEVGWHVYPGLYSSGNRSAPRLFIRWTADGYHKTGCFNLLCKGFVQKSTTIVPGMTLNVSSFGNRIGLPIYVHKDAILKEPVEGAGAWWLFVGEVTVGYWPAKIFRNFENSPVKRVDLGGTVRNTWSNGGSHTKTQMGNGLFPSKVHGKLASRFYDIKIYKDKTGFFPAKKEDLKWKIFTEEGMSKCYNVSDVMHLKNLGYYFSYGGPGGSDSRCTTT